MSPNPHPIHAIIRCTVWIGLVIQQYQQRKELHQELNDLQQKLNDNLKKSRREHKDLLQELGDQFGKFDKTFCELDEPEITLLPSQHHDPISLYAIRVSVLSGCVMHQTYLLRRMRWALAEYHWGNGVYTSLQDTTRPESDKGR
jgi:hypothetical protein